MNENFDLIQPWENPTPEEIERLRRYLKAMENSRKEENQAKLLLLEQELREGTPQADKVV